MLWIFPQEAEQVLVAQQVGWTNTIAMRTMSPTAVNVNPLAIEVGREREGNKGGREKERKISNSKY